MKKGILIAFDDSENAMAAVEKVAETFTPDHKNRGRTCSRGKPRAG